MENHNENQEKKNRRKVNKTLFCTIAVVFIVAVLVLSFASIIKPDVKYSEAENRVLTQLPKLDIGNVRDKSFMTDLEDYTADQFILRDWWIRLKVNCELLTEKREFNGVYLGKDQYLMQIPTEPDQKNVQDNLDAMNQFAEQNKNLTMNAMIVPNAAYVMQDYLPEGAPVRDQGNDMEYIQKQLNEGIGCIDVTKTLQEHLDEGIYYKTDHHWTTKGAAYAFDAAATQLGIEETVKDYKIYTVTMDFSGTLASKSGYHKAEDSIEVYEPENTEIQYLVSDSDNEEKRPTVYDRSALEGKDKYQVFFGGNHARVDITTANKTKKKLLVFKDSYANCFVPFLLPYYNEIVMIDPRYYYDNVQTLITNKGITDVLFLYNMDTFLNDNSLADVLITE